MNKSMQNIEDSESGQNSALPCQAYEICMRQRNWPMIYEYDV